MKKLLLLLALVLFVGANPATAQIVNVPEQRPLFSFEVPSRWAYERIGRGVQLLSPDEEIYAVVQAISPFNESNLDSILADLDELLVNRGFSSPREVGRSSDTHKGVPLEVIRFTSRLEGRRVDVIVTVGAVGRRGFVSMVVGDANAFSRNARALQLIRNSTEYYTR